jgi:hypothetical protein
VLADVDNDHRVDVFGGYGGDTTELLIDGQLSHQAERFA